MVDDHPVVCVSRGDAIAYANWAGRRLPTSLEWQRAARGIHSQPWPWGNTWDASACNINGQGTTSVTTYERGISPAGCWDMVGNVWEWLADRLEGQLLLIGGSWELSSTELVPRERLTFQMLRLPHDGTKSSIGFRCAMDVPESH
jgi:formylglycine-generating enzyme required for sulfatase activity